MRGLFATIPDNWTNKKLKRSPIKIIKKLVVYTDSYSWCTTSKTNTITNTNTNPPRGTGGPILSIKRHHCSNKIKCNQIQHNTILFLQLLSGHPPALGKYLYNYNTKLWLIWILKFDYKYNLYNFFFYKFWQIQICICTTLSISCQGALQLCTKRPRRQKQLAHFSFSMIIHFIFVVYLEIF